MAKPLNRECVRCGKVYIHKGKHTECSLECRLLNRIKIVNGCWEWKDFICPMTGYGKITYERKCMTAHRLSYIYHKGDIPPEMFVCHVCDNPKCINPDHPFIGTAKDNSRDMVKKGRHVSHLGENNQCSRLTENQVIEIRRLCSEGVKQIEIGKMFGIDQCHVSDIKLRKLWKHI